MGRVGVGMWLWAVGRWLGRWSMGRWMDAWWLWTGGVVVMKAWWASVGWLGNLKVVGWMWVSGWGGGVVVAGGGVMVVCL